MLSPSADNQDVEFDEDQYDDYIDSGNLDSTTDLDNFDLSESDESDSNDLYRALEYDPNQLSHSNGIPVNGHDFLKMVQEEREKLPQVMTAPLPKVISKTISSKEVSNCETSDCEKNVIKHCLTNEQDISDTESAGSEATTLSIKQSIESVRDTDNDNDHSKTQQADTQDMMGSKKEAYRQIRLKSKVDSDIKNPVSRELTHKDQIIQNFLSLKSKIDEFRGRTDSDLTDSSGVNHSALRARKWRANKRVHGLMERLNLGRPPQVDQLSEMSQMEIHMTLECLAEQCERSPICSNLHADWIYSLLCMLREPIEPDICATLRRLAKVCLKRRDHFEKRTQKSLAASSGDVKVQTLDEEEYYGSLLIVCLIRHHFGQSDLK